MGNDKFRTIKLILISIFVIALLGGLFNIPINLINQIIQWLTSFLVGAFLSLIAATIVEEISGDLLKKILLTISITGDIKFSISLFCIATFFVKILLFGL